jgi:hypothetical protein
MVQRCNCSSNRPQQKTAKAVLTKTRLLHRHETYILQAAPSGCRAVGCSTGHTRSYGLLKPESTCAHEQQHHQSVMQSK